MARTGWAAAVRRAERDAARRRRELVAQEKQIARWQEAERAQHEVDLYESQLEFLLSMHKDCGPAWDWREVVGRPPPQPPRASNAGELAARCAADSYSPGFFERLFGGAKRRKAALEREIAEACQRDAQRNALARSEFTRDLELHRWLQQVAPAVLAGDLDAYGVVMEHLSPFDELVDAGMQVQVEALRRDVVVLRCVVSDQTIVPAEEKRLSASGKLSTRALAAGKYWAVYQDYVCGCALRAARETYALLPVPRVVVNVGMGGVDPSTGHPGLRTVLAVSMPRATATSLNYDALDPSDSLKNFPHRMKFKKTTGFEAVDPIHADESFIDTGRSR